MTMQAKLTVLGEWSATGAALAGGDFINSLIAANTPWGQPVTVTGGVVTWPAHGLVAGQLVYFTSPLLTATFTGITPGTVYAVAGTVNANSFQLAALTTPTTVIANAAIVAAGSMAQGFQVTSNPVLPLPNSLFLPGLTVVNDIAIVGTVGAPVAAGTAVTVTSATPAVVTWAAHNFSAGQPIFFTAATLPTGITAGANGTTSIVYYVSSAGLAAGAFQFAATQAAALAGTGSIATSSTGTTVVGWATNGIDAPANGFSANLTGPTANAAILPTLGSSFLTLFNGVASGGNTLWVFPPLGGIIYGSNPSVVRTANVNTAWNINSAFPITANKSTVFQCADPLTTAGVYTYVAQHAA